MAAPAYAFTISRAAEILGDDEELLWDLATNLEPEDGCLWIHGTNDQQTMALTDRGGWNACGSRSRTTSAAGHPRGPERMLTAARQADWSAPTLICPAGFWPGNSHKLGRSRFQ